MSERRMAGGYHVGNWAWDHRGQQEHFSKMHKAFLDSSSLARDIENITASIRTSRDLTESGKRKALAEWAKTEAIPVLAYARAAISGAKTSANEKRAAVRPGAYDKADLVGFWRRKELREHFAKLDPAARAARLAMGTDPELAAALTEYPADVVGISKDAHAKLQADAVLAAHPETAAELAEIDAATDATEAALRAAMKSISKVAGVPEHELRVMLGEPSYGERIAALLPGGDGEDADAA
jgi:hypothetical protein